MENSMIHWNGCQMVAIDTETTGLDPHMHEIIQIAMLPLDSNCDPRQDVLPFYIEMVPERPEAADREAMRVNALKLAEIARRGHDQESAKDLLDHWINTLGLPMNKGGINRCKILPLGHNYAQHDRAFIRQWLGSDLYDEYFHYVCRDTMLAMGFLNDIHGMHADAVLHPRYSLSQLAANMGVVRERAHDALDDCRVTAQCYKRLISRGILAM